MGKPPTGCKLGVCVQLTMQKLPRQVKKRLYAIIGQALAKKQQALWTAQWFAAYGLLAVGRKSSLVAWVL